MTREALEQVIRRGSLPRSGANLAWLDPISRKRDDDEQPGDGYLLSLVETLIRENAELKIELARLRAGQ